MRSSVSLAAILAFANVSCALARPGPDAVFSDAGDIASFGAVGGVRAYALGTTTCNVGDQNLLWTNLNTPVLASNLYRLHNGRLVQIGIGWCKTACCAAPSAGCSLSCNGVGGQLLGAGCREVNGAAFNATQARLTARSRINAFTGAIPNSLPGGDSTPIERRLQVAQADLDATAFPGALFFIEGVYVSTDDAQSGNALNNASHKRVTVSPATLSLLPTGAPAPGVPAIQAWRDHGLGLNQPDSRVTISTVDVPNEGRFWIASKVTDLGDGSFLYDYAIFNLNSDAAGGSLSVPLPAGVSVTGVGFHDVNYHSGEPYSSADWNAVLASDSLTWRSPQTFQQNPNSSALRWGTMCNFWFEADAPPTAGSLTLGLFKPHTPQSIVVEAPVPGGVCAADWNADGALDSQDFFDFIVSFFDNNADFNADGTTTSQDFFDFLATFFAGC